MNYWYAPVNDSHLQITPRLPPELIAAVAAPWRSTSELEAIRAKSKKLSHYDMSGAAHSILMSRKRQESEDAVRALRQSQCMQELHQDMAALEAFTAVDAMWTLHLDQLRGEASAAVRAVQEKHEDALTKLRMDQVARATDTGIRPRHRSKELLNLRRSELVLVAEDNYPGASRVKAHADQLAAAEASGAHMSWLLKCHGEQERLLAQQRRELETLCKRMDTRLRDVELARDRDLEKLERKIKVATVQQRRDFVKERQYMDAALGGSLLNTRTTRIGRGPADAFPTLARIFAFKEKPEPPASRPASSGVRSVVASAPELEHGSGCLAPSTSDDGAAGCLRGEDSTVAHGVRFAPTPPRREAWVADSNESVSGNGGSRLGSAGSGSRISNTSVSGSGHSRASTSSSSRSSYLSSGKGSGSNGYANRVPEPLAPADAPYGVRSPVMVAGGAPSSAAVASGTTAAATESGSSALTEEALIAMNQAMGVQPAPAQRGANSLQSSSFKSNRPYAGGLSARVVAKPVSRLVF